MNMSMSRPIGSIKVWRDPLDRLFDLCQSGCQGPVSGPTATIRHMPDQERPALVKGDIWRTSRPGIAREIVDLDTGPDGIQRVRYRTRYGEFVCSEPEFRFWIERRSAWPSGTKIGGTA